MVRISGINNKVVIAEIKEFEIERNDSLLSNSFSNY